MTGTKFSSALIQALFGGQEDRTALLSDIDDGCTVCDHPFGHMPHMCLSSGSSIGIAS